jgi:hypothetical protein
MKQSNEKRKKIPTTPLRGPINSCKYAKHPGMLLSGRQCHLCLSSLFLARLLRLRSILPLLSILIKFAADVKSDACSKLGRTGSMLCRKRSYDGLARSYDGLGRSNDGLDLSYDGLGLSYERSALSYSSLVGASSSMTGGISVEGRLGSLPTISEDA